MPRASADVAARKLLRALLLAAACACPACGSAPSSGVTPGSPPHDAGRAPPNRPAPSSGELTLELTANDRAAIPEGSVLLVGAGYEHLDDSRNASNAILEVCRRGECLRGQIERMHPGEVTFVRLLDVEIGLESADPYHQPSRARVLLRW